MKVVELGDEVECRISGFKGIVTSYAKCLTGCDRIVIQPIGVTKEGKLKDGLWFDVYAVKILKKQKVKAESVQAPQAEEKTETTTTRKLGGPPSRNLPY